VVRLDYLTVICTVFTSYLTGLTNRNELIPDIATRITNACYIHIPVLKRQTQLRGINDNRKTLIGLVKNMEHNPGY